MKNFKFDIDGKSYETSLEEISNSEVSVTVNGVSYKVHIENNKPETPVIKKPIVPQNSAGKAETPQTAPTPKTTDNTPVNGTKVVSPLPGSVIKVLVSEGQNVKNGDVLLTLESMKMENTIQADCDGVVGKINVTAGQNVMQGDVLLIIQ